MGASSTPPRATVDERLEDLAGGEDSLSFNMDDSSQKTTQIATHLLEDIDNIGDEHSNVGGAVAVAATLGSVNGNRVIIKRRFQALDPNLDPKKLNRLLQSRVYSRRSRMKKCQYIAGLESRAKALQEEIEATKPKLVREMENRKQLESENNLLRFRVSTRLQEELLSNAMIENRRGEINRLRQALETHGPNYKTKGPSMILEFEPDQMVSLGLDEVGCDISEWISSFLN